MKSLFASIVLALFVAPVLAQQASSNTASTANVPVNIAPVFGSTPAHTSADVNYQGSYSAKTTGQVFLPGNSVASGSFNCGATGSAGIGGTGFSVGLSGSKSLEECVKLNLLNMAGIKGDPQMFDAVWCTIAQGREAMIEAGRECPSQVRARQQAAAPVASAPVASRPRVGQTDSMGRLVQ